MKAKRNEKQKIAAHKNTYTQYSDVHVQMY